MKQKNKTLKVLIIVVMVLIIILLGAISYLYFMTDILRSNKQNFFKYTIQMANNVEEGFIDSRTREYYEKKKNTPYSNRGKISFKYDSLKHEQEFKQINDLNISFSGQVDNLNSKNEQDIAINYSSSVKFPFKFRKVGDIAGFQTKYIGEKFVAFNTTDPNSENMINDQSILSVKEGLEGIQETKLSEEETNHLIEVLSNVLNEQLGDDKFSEIDGKGGYQLKLTSEDLKKLVDKLNETIENDEVASKVLDNNDSFVSNMLNGILDTEENEIYTSNKEIRVAVYVSQGVANKIEVTEENSKVLLQRAIGNDESQYQILIESGEDEKYFSLEFSARYTGLESMQNVNGTFGLSFATSSTEKYNYTLNTEVEFIDSVNIEDFTESNSVTLTDSKYSQESVSNFLNNVTLRIEEVNKQQMEELGVSEDENPLQYVIPIKMLLTDAIGNSTISFEDEDMAEQITTFNAKFTNYESNKSSAQTVKGLMSVIQNNNEQSNIKIKEIHLNGEEYKIDDNNISEIKDKIEMEKSYRVEFEMDTETGAIYRVVINEVATQEPQESQTP